MRVLTSVLVFACALGPVASAAAPTVVSFGGPRVVKTAVRAVRPSYTAVEYDGKMLVQYSVIVSSAVKASDQIVCSATALTTDVQSAGVRTLTEEASSTATRSGSNASCSVTVPYAWALSSAVNDTVIVTAKVSNLAANGLPSYPERTSTQTVGTLPVPANGAVSTFVVKTVL